MTESSSRSAAHTAVAQWGFIGAVLLLVFLSGGVAFGVINDQDPPQVQVPTTDMKSGQLTGKHEKSAEISGKDYTFHLKISFADDKGRSREWKEFRRGDYVQYHLKQGQIDFLLLELPK